MSSNNTKTRMCRYIRTKGSCRNMSMCNFAHNTKELTPMECRDGDNCRFISIATDTGYYYNFNGRVCEFIHPEENKDNFLVRLNIKNMEDRISEERRSNTPKTNSNQLLDRIDNLESTVKTLVMVIKELNKKIDNMAESMEEAVEEEVVEEDEGFIDDYEEGDEESEYTPSLKDEEVLYAEDVELDSLVKTGDEESEDEESEDEESEDEESEDIGEGVTNVYAPDEDYTPSVGSEELYKEDKRYNLYVVDGEELRVANTLMSISV